MSIIKSITIMVEPLRPDEIFLSKQISNPRSVHESANYIQLVDELKKNTTASVTLMEDFMQRAPPYGIVILYPRSRGLSLENDLQTCSQSLQETLPRRLVLLNVIRTVYELNQYNLAAIVEDLDYDNWWNIEQLLSPRQKMIGLASIAKELGVFFRLERDSYCHIFGEEFERLPILLIRYLEAYARMFPEVLE